MIPLLLAGACTLGFTLYSNTATPPSRAAYDSQPVLVLLHHSVWFGSVDLPWFILYSDGRAIFPSSRRDGIPTSYSETRIHASTSDELLATLGIGPDFFALDTLYDYAPNITDQETVFLYVWRGSLLKRVAVRAGLASSRRLDPHVPAPFRIVFDRLVEFHSDTARRWHPDSLEVAAWPYEYAPDNPPLPWPRGWPDLNTAGTTKRPDPYVGQLYLMRLPYDHLDQLRRLLARRREKQAISISANKVAVGYRLLFPGEERWRQYVKHLEE